MRVVCISAHTHTHTHIAYILIFKNMGMCNASWDLSTQVTSDADSVERPG